MVIFHSYVSLPEGNLNEVATIPMPILSPWYPTKQTLQ